MPALAKKEDWLDRAALGASFLCLVHCLGLPLLLAALPALSRLLAVPERLHVWLIVFAVPVSGTALLGGRARYGISWPLLAGTMGITILALSASILAEGVLETGVTCLGSLMLATAHLGNWRLRRARHTRHS